MKIKLRVLSLLIVVLSFSTVCHSQISDPILGVWERTDGYSFEMKQSFNGDFEGFINVVGPLKSYGFTVGERILIFKKSGQSTYAGSVKYRWSSSRSEWRQRTMILNNNELTQMDGSSVVSKYTRKSRGPVACPNFLGIGKLVAMLEMGSVNGYDNNWMISTIDYALQHVKSSNCLSPTYLKGLRPRILRTNDNRQFYNEIHSYSLSLDSEVLNCF